MAKISYVSKSFRDDTLELIKYCESIITLYQSQGFRLTLRQLYYQLVSRDKLANNQKEYNRLGAVINDARLAGLIDWTAIEDRTRNVEINAHWHNPESVVGAAAASYHNDLWRNQEYRPEVWVEKDALEGVVESACKPLDVPFFSCRGYTSQTAMWEAAQRMLQHTTAKRARQKIIVFHLGDHDPSGIDMTRDITDRLTMFTGSPVEVKRIALNMDQIERYNPPPNPAKSTDSRFAGYVEIHGDESWELDALEPSVLVALIHKHILSVRDAEAWKSAKEFQERGRAELNAIAGNYRVAAKSVEDYVEFNEDELDEDNGSDDGGE